MKLLHIFLFDILSWLTQKSVLYSISVWHHMTQNCNCSCKVLGAASGTRVSGPRFGRSRMLGSFLRVGVAQAEASGPFSFISTRKLRQHKAETLFLSNLPAWLRSPRNCSFFAISGYFSANYTNTCLQWDLQRWELLVFGVKFLPPHIPCSSPPTHSAVPAPSGSSQLRKRQRNWHRRAAAASISEFFPAAIVDGAAATGRKKGPVQWPEANSSRGIGLFGLQVFFCFVPVPYWLFFRGHISNHRGSGAVSLFAFCSLSLHMLGRGGACQPFCLCLSDHGAVCRGRHLEWDSFLCYFVFFVPGESAGLSTFVSSDY